MPSSASRAVAAVLLLAVVAVGTAAPAAGQASQASTTMHVSLAPDGDAHWTVSARFALADANDTAAFDRLADEHVSGSSPVLSVDPYSNAAAMASEVTGRPMAVESVSRSAERTDQWGALRLSFDWTNFTRVEDNGSRLVLGDAFRTPSGTWLPGLNQDQVLVIEFPAGYVVESVSRGLDNRSIRVTGPAAFEPGRPSATLRRSGPGGSPGTTTPGEGLAVPSALSAGAALAILLAGAFLLYRRQRAEGDEPGAADDAARGGDDPEPVRPDELLSDEERVLRLLRAEGGRMKQVDIVEETDWSNAKVSQLLSGMAEAGRIEKLRIGRENLISLPDREGEDE